MHFRWGKRKPQSYTYAPYFPQLEYNGALKSFFGGNFWDSRSTGYKLGNPDAEQAQHPPVDPNEHGFPDTACIAYRLSHAEYRPLFELVWGEGSLDIQWPADTEAICSTPEGAAVFNGSRNALHHHLTRSSGLAPASDAVAMPVALGPDDRTKANNVFDHWGQSLHAFEASANVSPFSSKFDAFLAGTYTLTADEQAGYDLFRGKGNCNSCHLDGRGTTLKSDQTDTSAAPGGAPLFTCFGSANEGLPRNPVIPFYYETQPDAFQYTPNPAGFGFDDLGMGLFLRSLSGINPNSEWIQYAPSVDGQMQVSSARNAAMTPPNCPTFQKAFFHNGYVKSLKELVHFYNTRDVFVHPVQRDRLSGPVASERMVGAGVGFDGDDHDYRTRRFPSPARSPEQETPDRPEASAETEGRNHRANAPRHRRVDCRFRHQQGPPSIPEPLRGAAAPLDE
jgi:cytochrome c peroxidase